MILYIILSILFLVVCNYFLKSEKKSEESIKKKKDLDDPIIFQNYNLFKKITKERKEKNLSSFHKNSQVYIINNKNINNLDIKKNIIIIYCLSENENKNDISILLKEKYFLDQNRIFYSKNEKVLRCYKFIFKDIKMHNFINN